MIPLNPYVLVVLLAIAGGYAITEKVKGPVKAVGHKLKTVGKKLVGK